MHLKKAAVVGAAATVILLFMGLGAPVATADTLSVFAAASTTHAVTEIGDIFAKRHQIRFRPSFASSSTLAKQIENGAPADLFLSANATWMDYLEEKQMIEGGSRIDLLSNRIALIVPADSNIRRVRIERRLNLAGLIGDSLLSMGDPDHVPAGIYGRQALESLDIWAAIERKVARAKDVRAALALVERGEAPMGLVYATDAALTDNVRVVGPFPRNSHPPVVYPVAIVSGRRSTATGLFLELLISLEARAVFEKYGFTVR